MVILAELVDRADERGCGRAVIQSGDTVSSHKTDSAGR